MNCQKALRIFFIYLLALMLAISSFAVIGGCSRKPAKSPSKGSGSEKKESQALQKLQADVEKLVKDFEKEYLKKAAPPPRSQGQGAGQAGQGQKQGDRQSGGQGGQKGGQSQGKGQGGGKEGGQQSGQGGMQGQARQAPEPDWAKFEKAVTQIHSQWNSFQPEAMKNGATPEMVGAFSANLNRLTMTLTRQDLYQGLLSANDLYEKTVSFEKLFKTKSPPEAKNILYNVRNALYRALNNEESEASSAMAKALAGWEMVKAQLKNMDTAGKVEFSLKEFQQALAEKDPNLIKIKAQIAEKNIQDAIKSMEIQQ